MKVNELLELIALAALWGGSFLFMRMGAGEFGPAALAGVRVVIATAALLPLLALRGQWPVLRQHWRPIFIVGVLNSALPFLCYAYAATSITSGLASIFNAATPLFGAVIAWLWLRDRPGTSRVVGLAIGFTGVVWLAADKASFKPGGSGLAVIACLAATLCYGIAASFTKKRLSGVAPLAVAAGSQAAAALLLIAPALLWWPATMPSHRAWTAVVLLGVASTAFAYLLYFRLIATIGPSRTIAVTFLIPLFALLQGWLFLGELTNASLWIGCAVILLGTSLATGLWHLPLRRSESFRG